MRSPTDMKLILTALATLVATRAIAQPSKSVVQACLTNKTAVGKVQYEEIDFSSVNAKDDPGRSLTLTTIHSGVLAVGKFERSTDNSFGIVYGRTMFPAEQIQRLGQARPEAFQVELAAYGVARHARNRYLCITFNFEGLGQSGSFQNVRGLYLIETSAKPMRTYYTVGDIRRYRLPPH